MKDGLADIGRETPAVGHERADQGMREADLFQLGGDIIDLVIANAGEHCGVEGAGLFVGEKDELPEAMEQPHEKDLVGVGARDHLRQATGGHGGCERVLPDDFIRRLALDQTAERGSEHQGAQLGEAHERHALFDRHHAASLRIGGRIGELEERGGQARVGRDRLGQGPGVRVRIVEQLQYFDGGLGQRRDLLGALDEFIPVDPLGKLAFVLFEQIVR